MYFHPLILTQAQMEHRLAAWEDMARAYVVGVERQYRWHAEAVNALFRRHDEGAKAILKIVDLANELGSWFALAVRMPLHLLPISMRSAEIAADIHREVTAVADIYLGSPRDSSAEESPAPGAPAGGGGAMHARQPQMMA